LLYCPSNKIDLSSDALCLLSTAVVRNNIRFEQLPHRVAFAQWNQLKSIKIILLISIIELLLWHLFYALENVLEIAGIELHLSIGMSTCQDIAHTCVIFE